MGRVHGDGKKHGFGIYKYANGDEYSGDWRDGKRDGRGILEYARNNAKKNCEAYSGYWKDGKRDENYEGTYKYANGDDYKGYWKDEKRHGWGTSKDANGIYSGDWQDGQR